MTSGVNILKVIVAIFLSILYAACDDEVKTVELDFIGDSLVDGWKVEKSFPSYITSNYGVSGARIEYIESMAGKFTDRTVVVLIGTNDKFQLADDTRSDYVKRYVEAIVSLNARKMYLISVLPREKDSDVKNFNEDIWQFNIMVQQEIKTISNIEYVDVYNNFLDNGQLIHKYFKDGLHLNDSGYKLLSKLLSAHLDPTM